jgi:ABC-type Fe3+-hydroxamate transport system substrate-binding protein
MRKDSRSDAPTRRDYVKYGGALLGSSLLAGCAGSGGTPTEGSTETATATEAATPESTPTPTDEGSYSVSMSPVGPVEFEQPPTNVMVYSLLYADMAVAYGYGDAVNSLGFSTDAAGALHAYYDQLDGVAFDSEGLTQLNTGSSSLSVDMELYYSLDSDLHLMDPALAVSFDGWSVDDVEEIRENVGPWFGNVYSRNNTAPPEPYADGYEYYTLWEISAKVAQVFQAQERYAELKAIRDDLLATIQADLPPEEDRPTVGSVIYMDGTFYPSKINTAGFANAHIRPLEAPDAFASGEVSYETAYDFETMLEVDPDVLLQRFGYSYYDIDAVREELESHSVGSELSAVQNGRVYAAGSPTQGPLMNLFQLEMTAKQLYPDQFGAWPGQEDGGYPEIPDDEQLFDRTHVAAVVNGEFDA